MSPETIARVLQPPDALNEGRRSIGIGSVIRRIELLYGAPYGVQLESVIGEGTLVRLKLPYQLQEGEDN
ncbi:hypothetical protein HMSSN036_87030 [Paenibacillus macerans]|nr:hypothetical protein HMSSN036_87030 [Paenibacillus macerans]